MSEGVASVAVLLGAGASADAGIPTTLQMTDAVIAQLGSRDTRRLVEFIRHTLAADLARAEPRTRTIPSFGEPINVDVGVDVERLFASVELLVDPAAQPWSPFVANWHPGLEAFAVERKEAFPFSREAQELTSAIDEIESYDGRAGLRRALEKALRAVHDRSQKGGEVDTLLAEVRDEMLNSLFDVLRISEPARVAYLRPLIDLWRVQRGLTIATLNYDRSVENLASLEGEHCETGIEGWVSRDEFEWNEADLRLLKLHGSIDWVVSRHLGERGLPTVEIHTVRPDEKQLYQHPAVVFGEAGKLRAEGPFLDLLRAWADQLKSANNLLIAGYSFRDDHVNHVIARWFNSNSLRRIVVVDPSDPVLAEASFGRALAAANPRLPRGEKLRHEQRRFVYVPGTTREALPAAIEAARVKVAPTPKR